MNMQKIKSFVFGLALLRGRLGVLGGLLSQGADGAWNGKAAAAPLLLAYGSVVVE